MVARYRRAMRLRPVSSLKHVVDARMAVAKSVTIPVDVIVADENPTIASTNQVKIASTVHGIYLRVEASATENVGGAIPSFYLVVFKNPGGNLSNPNPTNIGGTNEKKFIIHQEMVMLENSEGGNARTVFNGVIKIPPRLKRFGIDDKLSILVRSFAVDTVACVQCIYKEFN